MIAYQIRAGSTDVSVVIRIIDSSDGTPETGVVYNTSGIDLQYRREGATSTAITEATLSGLDSAHSDGGFLHIGNGYYRLDLPDAACAANARGVLVHGTVTGMVVIGCYIQLVSYDPFDAVRMGMTALPNANAEASGGIYTRGTGAGQINQDSNGRVDVNVVAISADTTAADNCELMFDGTGYGGGTTRLSVNVDTIATDAIDADALASDGIAAIADAVWDEPRSGHTSEGTFGDVDTLEDVVDAVWDEASTGHTDSGKAGSQLWTAIDAILADTGTDGVVLANDAITAGKIADDAISSEHIATGALTADGLAADFVDEIVDEVVEGTVTLRQAIRLLLSVLTGKSSGGGTSTIVFRDIGDSKDRISATVDASGNRTAVGTRDGS